MDNAKSNPVICNTAGCGRQIYFDSRYLNPKSHKPVQLETPHKDGGPKPTRHYCIFEQYISKDEIIKATPPGEEELGHLLIYQDENGIYDRETKEYKFHCKRVCKSNWFWFTNYYLKNK